ncbi:MAG: Uma2 family endonuclease [Vicinamibacterales bacterium]
MRALVHVRDEELADRRAKGLDRRDEMWEGVLHMTPAPSLEHQRMLDELIEFLRPSLRRAGRGGLFSGITVFRDRGAEHDYRIPDLTFVTAGREHVLQPDGIRGEGPDAVIEIRSPDDETYEKLPFYAALGIPEVVVCDRDTKAPEIFRLAGSEYLLLQADRGGWLTSSVLGVRLRRMDGTPPRLRIEDTSESSVSADI